MLQASFLAAFLGGALSLLSPCSALLLPAFFAYAFASRTELLGRTLLFLAGLCAIFIPLGMGASLLASLLIEHRDTTVLVAGALLIAFGLLEIFGAGFTLVPASLGGRLQGERGALAVFGSGLVYGLAGFCSGPLLGAVLTVAASSADVGLGAALLFTYALGTAAPLFFLAWVWDRLDLGRRRWLRGRSLRVGPLALHTTSLVAGLLFVLLGASFVAFQGSSALSATYDDLGLGDLSFRAQSWVADNAGGADVEALLVALALAALGWTLWLRRSPQAGRPRQLSRRTKRLASPATNPAPGSGRN